MIPCPALPSVRRHLNAPMKRIDEGFSDATLLELARRLIDTMTALARVPNGGSGKDTEADRRIGRAAEWMREHFAEPVELADCARAAGYSVPHFSECFRARNGIAPMQYLRELCVQHACQLLDHGNQPVKAVAPAVGYLDPLHFFRVFKAKTGMAPKEYRRRVL